MSSTPTITMPAFPTIGLPDGQKEAGQRVDFKPDKFDLTIESHGYRLTWERALPCPCAPVTAAAEGMPDPNCDLCHGKGWIWFGEPNTTDFTEVGNLTTVQRAIIDENNAMVIRGIITSIEHKNDPHTKVGAWGAGSLNLTVRYQNKLSYYDRLTALDVEIAFSEVLEADGTSELEGRYLMTGVNHLRSVSTVYVPGVDFELNTGKIAWLMSTPPTTGTKIVAHYLCHPTWLVVEHPHAARVTNVKFKTATPTTPRGDPRPLPIQARIQYEFLPG